MKMSPLWLSLAVLLAVATFRVGGKRKDMMMIIDYSFFTTSTRVNDIHLTNKHIGVGRGFIYMN